MSTTAPPVDFWPPVLDSGDPDVSRDLAWVHVLGYGRSVAGCSCGWLGRCRLLRASAMLDAWSHSAQGACAAASPLFLSR